MSDASQPKYLQSNIEEKKELMKNHYEASWHLYMAHSSSFTEDLPYYLDFTRGYETLELFAGYGRITNYLTKNAVDVEVVELSAEFASCIDLPESRKHIGDVTTISVGKKFERVIAGYNSFCLLRSDEQLCAFFRNLDRFMVPGGKASLSYYHPDAWAEAEGQTFVHGDTEVDYQPSFDLSQREEKLGTWTDTYILPDRKFVFDYPVRIFENFSDIEPFIMGTGLRLSHIVESYNNPNIAESGWVEYILQKI